jgi:hypothetical protein
MPETSRTRTRRWWAAPLGLGAAACGVCCAGALVTALGVGAGSLAAVGAITDTLSLALLGSAGVAGVIAYRRARQTSCDACAGGGACGCREEGETAAGAA